MLLRGTKRVATISELAPSTSTGSVFCGDWAATKFGRAKQASRIKFAAAAGSRPVIGRLMTLISNRKYSSGITISMTGASSKHECECFGRPQSTQCAHLLRPEHLPLPARVCRLEQWPGYRRPGTTAHDAALR